MFKMVIHPGINRIYDVFENNDSLYVAMEKNYGSSLEDYRSKETMVGRYEMRVREIVNNIV